MEEQINALLAQMTLAEKVSLLAGVDTWRTVPIDRLNIPSIQVTDGPNGARGEDDNIGLTSISFPVGSAMGSTWNPDLIEQVGAQLAREANAKGADVLLAPTVNIARTPVAGRNFECFAEDPYLSGTIAAAYIAGLQGQGVSACLKHFICNDQEFERTSMSSQVAERPLHEIYLEPFRIALQKANPWSVMSSYNRINGVHASENDATLHDILKKRWGYDGAVISDWYGTYSDGVPGGYLDLEMPGPARWMDAAKITAAIEAGTLSESHVDDKVRRLLRLMARVGAFAPDHDARRAWVATDTPTARQLARQVADEAIVLLKNEASCLPLDPDQVKSIAVIGENGQWAQIMGGGSSVVNAHYAVSPLAGIQQRVGKQAQVEYAIGTPIHRQPPLIDPSWLSDDQGQVGNLTLEYFNNLDLVGPVAQMHTVHKSQLTWFGTVNPYVDPANFSLRLTGNMTVPVTGAYQLELWSIGRGRMWVNGELLVDHWQEVGHKETRVTVELVADEPASLRIEYSTDPLNLWRTVRLGCIMPLPEDPIQVAVDLAKRVDVAVVVVGLTREWETEGFDRPDLELVGRQNELVARVAAANPRTVVVLNVGSPVTMPWLEEVPAVVQMWYAGQEAGHALAGILFGDVNPSGKLSITFPVRYEDNPAYINYPGENGQVLYGEGLFVGYRYYDKKALAPLFPFGYGLAYTSFAYNNLRLSGDSFKPGDEMLVQVDVTNTGDRAGYEVVQVYVEDEVARVVRPQKELKAFAKVHLQPGQAQTVTLRLEQQSLAFYDPARADWATESGVFRVHVGSSSRDIRLTAEFTWHSGEPEKEKRNTWPW
ncbi:MAG: glycoside hydrolase family 3 C-terminal domain-containing protein [Chloroflexi bacterium]|nr:glycoside hydrolase family 3 C-terminal domain-containing protein [Chloroflexota bacterium]MBP8059765.1 glycoside hydrolase family 3 C-terminal domain-containing protein [Chloroflexota bacterium]